MHSRRIIKQRNEHVDIQSIRIFVNISMVYFPQRKYYLIRAKRAWFQVACPFSGCKKKPIYVSNFYNSVPGSLLGGNNSPTVILCKKPPLYRICELDCKFLYFLFAELQPTSRTKHRVFLIFYILIQVMMKSLNVF